MFKKINGRPEKVVKYQAKKRIQRLKTGPIPKDLCALQQEVAELRDIVEMLCHR